MHCFRVVLDSGGECVPVSPKYEHIKDAIEHYDHLSPGLHACLHEAFEVIVSEYIDVEGHEYAFRDFSEGEMSALRRRGTDTRYTVVGFYADNQQPWATTVEASLPMQAAADAVREMMVSNEWDTPDDIRVVEVLVGDCRCTAVTQQVMAGQEALDAVAPSEAGVSC